MGNVITPLRPTLSEMVTESAAPTSSPLSRFSGLFDVLLRRAFVTCEAVSATVTLNMMVDEILVKEIFSLTEVALKLLWALLIRLLVAPPVCFFRKWFFTDSTEVFLDGFRTSSPWSTRYASLVIVLLCRGSAQDIALP
jgi:hypothetical protein